MAKRGATRRRGLFGTIYRPISGILNVAGKLTGTVTNTARNIVKRGIKGVNNAGRNVTGSANSAVRNVLRGKGKGKGSRSTRKRRNQ
jgi:hypothetical protein